MDGNGKGGTRGYDRTWRLSGLTSRLLLLLLLLLESGLLLLPLLLLPVLGVSSTATEVDLASGKSK